MRNLFLLPVSTSSQPVFAKSTVLVSGFEKRENNQHARGSGSWFHTQVDGHRCNVVQCACRAEQNGIALPCEIDVLPHEIERLLGYDESQKAREMRERLASSSEEEESTIQHRLSLVSRRCRVRNSLRQRGERTPGRVPQLLDAEESCRNAPSKMCIGRQPTRTQKTQKQQSPATLPRSRLPDEPTPAALPGRTLPLCPNPRACSSTHHRHRAPTVLSSMTNTQPDWLAYAASILTPALPVSTAPPATEIPDEHALALLPQELDDPEDWEPQAEEVDPQFDAWTPQAEEPHPHLGQCRHFFIAVLQRISRTNSFGSKRGPSEQTQTVANQAREECD